ncbi:MAG: enoyl-CoA hydratase/carnithine racemase [Halieaceae bacterium]|jgi:enoyl-CoA hydratase/carnithine racemase
MSYNTIKYEISDKILTITIDRPEQLNAFSVEMAGELRDAFIRASADDAISAIVVTGSGRAFCAGMDLSASGNTFGLSDSAQPSMADMENKIDDPDFIREVRDTGGLLTLAIYECNKPVIAAINGAAVGIGATMTCAMDIRLASVHAKIGFVFNKIGIVPEACSSWFLPRIVGISQALEWSYTGEILSATAAKEAGFVKAVLAADELLDEAYRIAGIIAQRSPVAIALTRQMMYRNSAQSHPIEAHKVDSLAVFYTSQIGGNEGIQAFLEKRPAQFTDTVSKDMPDFYPWW